MCFPFFVRPRKYRRLNRDLECSCDLCHRSFKNVEDLIVHMGYHDTDNLNERLLRGRGTVRCNRCWETFTSASTLYDHSCVIQGLSPLHSRSNSLETVIIHDWIYSLSYIYRIPVVSKIDSWTRNRRRVNRCPCTWDESFCSGKYSYNMLIHINE